MPRKKPPYLPAFRAEAVRLVHNLVRRDFTAPAPDRGSRSMIRLRWVVPRVAVHSPNALTDDNRF